MIVALVILVWLGLGGWALSWLIKNFGAYSDSFWKSAGASAAVVASGPLAWVAIFVATLDGTFRKGSR